MLFASTNDFGLLWVVFIGMLVVSFIWLIYMATCKPEVLKGLMDKEDQMRQKRHERRKEVLKGGVGAAGWLLKLLRK